VNKLFNKIIPRNSDQVLGVIISIAIIVFCVKSFARYTGFGTYYFDLGIMHQVVSNTLHGHFLEMTDPNFYFQGMRLGYHFDFILVFFAPFYYFFHDARVLLAGQSIILALGALPLYLLANDHLKNKKLSLLIVLSYLLYYPMHWTLMADFHAVTLATTFILTAWYFMEHKKYALMWVMIVLSWLTKENVALITGAIGLYVFFKSNRKQGSLLIGLSLVWFLLVYKVIMPHYRGGTHFAETYYSSDILTNIHRLFRLESLNYIVTLLFPLLFVPILSPLLLLIALPEWLIILLSSNTNMQLIQYHYTALLTPFIFLSLIYGIKKVNKKQIILGLIILIQCYTFFTRSPLRIPYYEDKAALNFVKSWQVKLKDESIPVSTSGHLAPYFSGRRYFYNFLFDFAYGSQGIKDSEIRALVNHYEKAEYVIIMKSEMDPTDERVMRYYFHLKHNTQFIKIADEAGIEVYKKVYNVAYGIK